MDYDLPMANSTGIVLFVYNRPEHTKRVLDGLRRNEVEELYIFADGPKPKEDKESINKVREVIDDVDWCRTNLVEREENWGLADNTVDGVNSVFEENDRIIVFEDDDVPANDCIRFLRTCLEEYDDEERVMNVTGYSPPLDFPDYYPYDVYFNYRDCSWGWATWQSAWEKYERFPEEFLERVETEPEHVRAELRRAGDDLFDILINAIEGNNDSWSVWWALTLLRNDGLSLYPVKPRIRNIGFDGSGTHSVRTERFDVDFDESTTVSDLQLPSYPYIDPEIQRRFNKTLARDWRQELKYYIRRAFATLYS